METGVRYRWLLREILRDAQAPVEGIARRWEATEGLEAGVGYKWLLQMANDRDITRRTGASGRYLQPVRDTTGTGGTGGGKV